MQHHPEGYELPEETRSRQYYLNVSFRRVKRILQFILLTLLSHIFTLNMYFILLDSLEKSHILKTYYFIGIIIEFDTSFQDLTQTCSNGTLLARSFIKSLALIIAYGSKVFLVVVTVILPSIRSSAAFTYCNIWTETVSQPLNKNLRIHLWQ